MRNETVQAWLLGKLVHEGLDAPPTGADRNAMNEFIRAVSKDAPRNRGGWARRLSDSARGTAKAATRLANHGARAAHSAAWPA